MREKQRIDTDALYELIAAVVKQAVCDYEYALRGKTQFCGDRKYSVEELERFFLSDYGQMLSAGNGKWIIDQCKRKLAQGTGLVIDPTRAPSLKRAK